MSCKNIICVERLTGVNPSRKCKLFAGSMMCQLFRYIVCDTYSTIERFTSLTVIVCLPFWYRVTTMLYCLCDTKGF